MDVASLQYDTAGWQITVVPHVDVGGPNAVDPVRSWLPAECYILSAVLVLTELECEVTSFATYA